MFTTTGSTEPMKVLEQLCAGAELLPSQLPANSSWTPEKKLAAAVLSSGLLARDREWMESEDAEWPYSFRRLCELFALEPSWVRRVVLGTDTAGPEDIPVRTRFRHAA
jgi:hypothetical protein